MEAVMARIIQALNLRRCYLRWDELFWCNGVLQIKVPHAVKIADATLVRQTSTSDAISVVRSHTARRIDGLARALARPLTLRLGLQDETVHLHWFALHEVRLVGQRRQHLALRELHVAHVL